MAGVFAAGKQLGAGGVVGRALPDPLGEDCGAVPTTTFTASPRLPLIRFPLGLDHRGGGDASYPVLDPVAPGADQRP